VNGLPVTPTTQRRAAAAHYRSPGWSYLHVVDRVWVSVLAVRISPAARPQCGRRTDSQCPPPRGSSRSLPRCVYTFRIATTPVDWIAV